ncbi:calcium/calmodulin-dependent protein kinase kinase 2 [Cochliomyia hominivorax]
MDDYLHDQHGEIRELHRQDGSTIYRAIDNSMRSSKFKVPHLDVDDKKYSNQSESSLDQIELKVKQNSTLRSPESFDLNSLNNKNESRTDEDNVSSIETEYDDDKKDIVVGKLRNGCDKISFEQRQDFYILPGQLENISLEQSSNEIFKENVPVKSNTKLKDSYYLLTTTYRANCTMAATPSSCALIPLTGQNTTKIKETDRSKCERDKKKEPHIVERCDESSISKCTGDGVETMRALKSQSKRQSSFLKSQSLEIVQDSPSILSYSYHDTDDDEHIFFQLPEINEDNLQRHQNPKDAKHSKDHRQINSQSLIINDDNHTKETSENGDKTINGDDVAISRSLSLSSEKTGRVLKSQSLESRPIYPNVPYSPYASPYNSPRSNRRRPPLRESRRISIEQSGSFLQLNQYKLMDQIGQGSYGLVKLAYSEEDSTHYAMKILSKRRLLRQAGLMKRGPKKSTSPLDRVYREIAVLKKLDHPNVVKLVEVLDDPVEDSLYMVFELVKQGEVLSVPTKNPLSEERAWSVFRDTLLGLEYLHYQRIIHADIKPGNLLLTECGRVKIADLGVCNEFIGENATMTNGSTAGTPAFRAPESLNIGQNIYCGKAADIWALGATLYALVYGNVPFVASSVPALYEKIKNDALMFPNEPKMPPELRDCIQCMLKKDPANRITLPQLKEHVWVTAGGVHPLPTEEENCRLVQVNDEDINSVVRSIPKLDTLILIKTMLKKHSFGNPFSRGISGRAPQRGGSRLERFIRAGRSNSAPGSYNMIFDRQLSGDNILPALCEHSSSNSTNEESQ